MLQIQVCKSNFKLGMCAPRRECIDLLRQMKKYIYIFYNKHRLLYYISVSVHVCLKLVITNK